MRQRLLGAGLVILAVVQVGLLATNLRKQADVDRRDSPLSTGDTIQVLVGTVEGRDTTLEFGRNQNWTALLVFHSKCVFSQQVAADWKDWLSQPHDYHVVLLSREPADSAAAFQRAQLSHGTLLIVNEDHPGSAERRVSGNTPWLFLIDSRGVIRFDGQGRRLLELDSVYTTSVLRSVESLQNDIDLSFRSTQTQEAQ